MAKPLRTRSGRAHSNGFLDGTLRSLFRAIFHALLCIAGLVLGFRLSGEAVLFMGTSTKGNLFPKSSSFNMHGEGPDVALRFPYITEAWQGANPGVERKDLTDRTLQHHFTSKEQGTPDKKSNRVHVGRHEILIRPQPHPDPLQSIRALSLLERVQQEQMLLYELDVRKQLLVITPTFARTFQALHLTSLIHTLRIIPIPLTWVVIEAGEASNETASLLSRSKLPFHHLGLPGTLQALWEDRHEVESRLRTEGLRFIREKRLDGIVVFMDDSNTYSLEFFKEVQKTKWIGAFSFGLLSRQSFELTRKESTSSVLSGLPVQGPACDSGGNIVGWYAPITREKSLGGDKKWVLEWAGFSLNARLLWGDYDRPPGFRSWNEIFNLEGSSIASPLDFVQNTTFVEPLGNCGRRVLLWWLRVEARGDSKFPSRWEINSALEIVVPSKRTPWPDPPPKRDPITPPVLVSSDLAGNGHEKHRVKQNTRSRKKKKAPV